MFGCWIWTSRCRRPHSSDSLSSNPRHRTLKSWTGHWTSSRTGPFSGVAENLWQDLSTIRKRSSRTSRQGSITRNATTGLAISAHSFNIFQHLPPCNFFWIAQVQGITYLLQASDHEIHHLASHLALFLNVDQAEQLADHLLSSILSSSGSAAVWSSMGENSDRYRWSSFLFLRELLIIWKNAVPQAHVRKLHEVIARFDQGVAQRCFPSFLVTSPDADNRPVSKQIAEMVDVGTAEGRRRLLLATIIILWLCSTWHGTTSALLVQ